MTHDGPQRILVELPQDVRDRSDVVLAAALTLFGPAVEVALCVTGLDGPTQEHAGALLRTCSEATPSDAVLPTIDLLGHTEALGQQNLLHVVAGGSAFDEARAVVRLGALAESLRSSGRKPAGSAPAPHPQTRGLRERLAARTHARDLSRRDAAPKGVLVVAVVQVQSCWPALESICEALEADDTVQLEVVALESEHMAQPRSTQDFVRDLGYVPRDASWFEQQLADTSGPLSLVLLDNPYDDVRPKPLQSLVIANAGVRMAYSPYSNNVGAGERLFGIQYTLPLYSLAWRIYLRSQTERDLFAAHCQAGADHVRLLGMPKLDRVVRAAARTDFPGLRGATDRPVVLWNAHFTFGAEGRSTFDRYLGPLLRWFVRHDDVELVMRPHPRLWRDLRLAAGGRMHPLEKQARKAVRDRDNIHLDESEDYLPSFISSTAMISDLSSMITEYLPMDKPVLYLHKEDGTGVHEDAQDFFRLDLALRWEHVEAFLEQVRVRADAGAGRREVLLRDHFGELDGRSGERVAADLLASLSTEIAALPRVAAIAAAP